MTVEARPLGALQARRPFPARVAPRAAWWRGRAHINFSDRWVIWFRHRQNCMVDGVLVTADDILLDGGFTVGFTTLGSLFADAVEVDQQVLRARKP